ncbi:hypothetical protein AD998_20505 [bacterium 336/3]|nr:hypothetical protein AD998_20505 [bacterium 336/3]
MRKSILLFIYFFSAHLISAQSLKELYQQGMKYYSEGNYLKAIEIFERAVPEAEKQFGKNHKNYTAFSGNLAMMYQAQGLYSKAETLFLEVKEIDTKIFGKEHSEYATDCNNLAMLYLSQGLYSKAEPLFLEAKEIDAKTLGVKHPNYATDCNNLAMLYLSQGSYSKAEALYLEAKEIRAIALGKRHPDYAQSCNNLAGLYYELKMYSKAEPLYLEAKEIRAIALGKQHPDYAQSCNNLAALYDYQGLYSKAEPLYLEAKEIRVTTLGKEHPLYAHVCNNLAGLYKNQQLYSKAEPLYLEAKEIHGKTLGKQHPDYALSCSNLAFLYWRLQNYEKADMQFQENSQIFVNQIQTNFAHLSEKEKEQFFNGFKNNFEVVYSFAIENKQTSSSAWLYNNILVAKAVLFASSQNIRNIVKKSNNPEIKKLFVEWLAQRERLTKIMMMSLGEKQKQQINQKAEEEKANILEKRLSVQSEAIGSIFKQHNYQWKDIQKKLKSHEVAIEINRVRYYNTKKEIFTDSILYVALIVTPQTQNAPEMVVLHNGKELETTAITYYTNCIKAKKKDKESYGLFWKPLKDKIGNAQKIYIAPDGIYHQINLETLTESQTEKYIKDEVSIHLVSSTRDLIYFTAKKQVNYKNYQLHLFGYPDYAGSTQKSTPAKDRDSMNTTIKISKKQRFLDGFGTVSVLPGTKTEIVNISTKAKSKGIKVKTYLGSLANEETLKNIQDVHILHIATHGFFESDVETDKESTKFENPLLRSGLLLTNAELALQGKISGTEDGILTAQEVMNMDLYGTDLVVLSACETGLGEIRNGEGVYGLQRAFQEAGARNIVMSLWKVDDEATQKMMSLFYENMLTKGMNKREAFVLAQTELQKKYPQPYYWGAFVLIGE